MRISQIALGAAAVAVLATPAAASMPLSTQEVVDVRIAFDDLDLTTADGRETLEARINSELRKACKVDSELPYRNTTIDDNCVKQGRAAALAQIDEFMARTGSGQSVAAR